MGNKYGISEWLEGSLILKKHQFFFALGLGVVLVVINIYGFSLLRQRAAFPDGAIDEAVIESQDFHLRVDGYDILNRSDFEFILSRKSSGEQILIELRGPKAAEKKLVTLSRFYSDVHFNLIYLLIGLYCIIIGTVVFLWKMEE